MIAHNVSALIVPGKRGSVYKCATQVTSMLTSKPSETFALVSKAHRIESDLASKVKYIGTISVNPVLRLSELITSSYKLVKNDCIAFLDGDAHVGPSCFQKMMTAFEENPNRVYCSSLKDLGDVDGFVCGAELRSDGVVAPLVYEEQGKGIQPILCLQPGFILFPRRALDAASKNGPCKNMEELSANLREADIEICCVKDAAISYKGLTNLGVEATYA
jgi:hypothetical protein